MESMEKETYIVEDKEMRRTLSSLMQTLNRSGHRSEERRIASEKIREAIMWFGLDLGNLGIKSPHGGVYERRERHSDGDRYDLVANGHRMG